MGVSVVWGEDGPGRVTIEHGGIGPARLFGLPFAAVGAYFLYQFLDGVLHPAELTIAGWVLLPVRHTPGKTSSESSANDSSWASE